MNQPCTHQRTQRRPITMASDDDDHTATAYGDEFLNDEEEEDESEQEQDEHQHVDNEDDVDVIDDEEEEDDSTSSAAGDVTISITDTPNTTTTSVAVTPITESKKPAAVDDSRRLFQRLWTDEDEIELLNGLLDYSVQRGHHHHDTTAFYDQVKGKLQLEFNKNQLVEKIRRLKKKYRNVLSQISSGKGYVFKSPHDQSTFDLSCKIWNQTLATIPAGIDDEDFNNPSITPKPKLNGNEIDDPNYSQKKVPRSRKRSRSATVKIEENCSQQQQHDAVDANVVEEALKSSLLPLFKELVKCLSNGPTYGNASGLGLGIGLMDVNGVGDMSDEKWRKQRVLELEVYSKRLELMQDEVKSKLEELRAMGNGLSS
ncbi:putative transcription factor At5g28040 [Bidens hawaiensis]|uniref:putative transcription factor At5g28040 n=1 Tax=Bidens hawaiensis TaxID=980011 RepID=UPI0040497506